MQSIGGRSQQKITCKIDNVRVNQDDAIFIRFELARERLNRLIAQNKIPIRFGIILSHPVFSDIIYNGVILKDGEKIIIEIEELGNDAMCYISFNY